MGSPQLSSIPMNRGRPQLAEFPELGKCRLSMGLQTDTTSTKRELYHCFPKIGWEEKILWPKFRRCTGSAVFISAKGFMEPARNQFLNLEVPLLILERPTKTASTEARGQSKRSSNPESLRVEFFLGTATTQAMTTATCDNG